MADLTELPKVVPVEDQPCQQLYEGNPVLLGYDVVAYHFIPSFRDGGVAVRGSPDYAYNFEGYQFWFESQEHRDLFVEDPWKYAPAFGGYCAWGVAKEDNPFWPWSGKHLGPPATPWEGWAIVNGTLLFNIWASYTDRFLEEVDLNFPKAVKRWKYFHNGQLQAGPFNTHCLGRGPMENFCLGQQPNPWLEALPECELQANGTWTGGGIVSPYDKVDDFVNARTTPAGRRMWTILGVLGGVFLLVCLVCLVRRVRRESLGANASDGAISDTKLGADDSDMGQVAAKPIEEGDVEKQKQTSAETTSDDDTAEEER